MNQSINSINVIDLCNQKYSFWTQLWDSSVKFINSTITFATKKFCSRNFTCFITGRNIGLLCCENQSIYSICCKIHNFTWWCSQLQPKRLSDILATHLQKYISVVRCLCYLLLDSMLITDSYLLTLKSQCLLNSRYYPYKFASKHDFSQEIRTCSKKSLLNMCKWKPGV